MPDTVRRNTMKLNLLGAILMAALSIAASTDPQPPAAVSDGAKPTVVLVHGAFAESSSWDGVIPKLEADGYQVIAVANPLRGLRTDSDYVAAVLDGIKGPVVLVGHSYGGSVITDAATEHADVKALVYVDGTAPDAGESTSALSAMFPGGTLGPALASPVSLPDGEKDLYILRDRYHDQFAADVPEAEAKLMFAAQRPMTVAALNEPSGPPAWKTIASWFIYGQLDKNIPPAAHAFMARRAGAVETVEVRGASHVVMVSHPDEVAEMIERAALAPWRRSPMRESPPSPVPNPHQDADLFDPAPVVPLASEPTAHLFIDSPLPEQLATGYVVVRYRAENLRIMPVYGPAALRVLPRIGHLHVTVDDLPWHWLDASGEPISINGLPPGPHRLLIELEDPTHKVIDHATVAFDIPQRPAPTR
jgi:pimeloyl-ACP methyl ester carboxylesterase